MHAVLYLSKIEKKFNFKLKKINVYRKKLNNIYSKVWQHCIILKCVYYNETNRWIQSFSQSELTQFINNLRWINYTHNQQFICNEKAKHSQIVFWIWSLIHNLPCRIIYNKYCQQCIYLYLVQQHTHTGCSGCGFMENGPVRGAKKCHNNAPSLIVKNILAIKKKRAVDNHQWVIDTCIRLTTHWIGLNSSVAILYIYHKVGHGFWFGFLNASRISKLS